MSNYLYRLAALAFRQRRLVLAVWLAAAIAAIAIAQLSGGKTNDNFTIPGTEAQHASDVLSAKLIGLIIAFFILMITFGAFAAAGMPILGAIIGVVTTLMGITAIASVLSIASASTTVALMLGLSCGIDYGLFILSRHRTNLL